MRITPGLRGEVGVPDGVSGSGAKGAVKASVSSVAEGYDWGRDSLLSLFGLNVVEEVASSDWPCVVLARTG